MTQNFRCRFKYQSQSCLQEKVDIILYQLRVNSHVCDVIKFILITSFSVTTGDVITNIAVSFSLRLAEKMLNMSLYN